MLDSTTKRRIDDCRDILVGKVPDPKSQIDQITVALIYKFMHDMDQEAVNLGGKATFFAKHKVKVNDKETVVDYAQYAWPELFKKDLSGEDRVKLYGKALESMEENPGLPQLFRDIFKNTYLPYRDPTTLREFLKRINEFTYDHSEKLGDAFEYLLSIMGSQGDAGQFRTPRHLIDFMTAVIDPQKHETILDPACGTAGFLISAYKHILRNNSSNHAADDLLAFQQHGMKLDELTLSAKRYSGDKITPDQRKKLVKNIVGYDIDPGMVKLSLVNLYLHGFPDPHIHEYDTLTSTDRWEERYDVILANPPFMSPKGGIQPHGKFGIPSTRSEVLFVDYIAEHLNPNGRAMVVVPEGIIFQSGKAYKALRKKLVDEHYLVGVVSVPGGVFNPYSGVKTSLLWFDRALARKTDKLLFVKVEADGFDLGAQRRPIAQNDLPEAFALMLAYKQALVDGTKWEATKGSTLIASVVKRQVIRDSPDYNLTVDRYSAKPKATGAIPLLRLEELFEIQRGGSPRPINDYFTTEPDGLNWVKIGDAEEGSKYITKTGQKIKPSGLHKTRQVKPGDFVLSNSMSYGRPYVMAIDGCIHDGWLLLRPKSDVINQDYAYHMLTSVPVQEQFDNAATGGVVKNLNINLVKLVLIPLPPLPEQEALVAEVEGYQQVIDGARQVLAHYRPRITIDPAWPMVELEEVVDLASGEFLPAKDMKEGPHAVYGGNGVNGRHNAYLFEEPTIVIGRVGAYCGAVHMTEPKSWITDNGLYVKKIKKEVDRAFLKQMLSALNLNQYAKVGGQPSISQSTVLNLSIPIPPLPEQQRIVAELEEERRLVEANKALVERMEAKVRERVARVWGERSDEQTISPPIHITSENGMPAHAEDKPMRVVQQAVAKPAATYAEPDGVLSMAAEPQYVAERRGPGRPRKGDSGNGQATEALMAYLQAHPGWHGKGSVLEATGVDAGAWNAAIKELLEAGKVERQGEKKGARYRVVNQQ